MPGHKSEEGRTGRARALLLPLLLAVLLLAGCNGLYPPPERDDLAAARSFMDANPLTESVTVVSATVGRVGYDINERQDYVYRVEYRFRGSEDVTRSVTSSLPFPSIFPEGLPETDARAVVDAFDRDVPGRELARVWWFLERPDGSPGPDFADVRGSQLVEVHHTDGSQPERWTTTLLEIQDGKATVLVMDTDRVGTQGDDLVGQLYEAHGGSPYEGYDRVDLHAWLVGVEEGE